MRPVFVTIHSEQFVNYEGKKTEEVEIMDSIPSTKQTLALLSGHNFILYTFAFNASIINLWNDTNQHR